MLPSCRPTRCLLLPLVLSPSPSLPNRYQLQWQIDAIEDDACEGYNSSNGAWWQVGLVHIPFGYSSGMLVIMFS